MLENTSDVKSSQITDGSHQSIGSSVKIDTKQSRYMENIKKSNQIFKTSSNRESKTTFASKPIINTQITKEIVSNGKDWKTVCLSIL